MVLNIDPAVLTPRCCCAVGCGGTLVFGCADGTLRRREGDELVTLNSEHIAADERERAGRVIRTRSARDVTVAVTVTARCAGGIVFPRCERLPPSPHERHRYW